MASYNKVLIMGNLTRDPELRVTSSGANICKFSVATSRKFRGADETMREETTFVDIDVFGRQAEVIAKYFKKGKPIFIEGRLSFGQWETKTGEKRSKLSVILENFQFLGGRDDAGASSSYEDSSPQVRKDEPLAAVMAEGDFDEDVPF